MRASPDGNALIILGRDPEHESALERPGLVEVARYVPGDDAPTFQRAAVRFDGDDPIVAPGWVRIPGEDGSSRAIGPLAGADYGGDVRVVETKRALWIAAEGQLVRLER
jgi:hypothetical protein